MRNCFIQNNPTTNPLLIVNPNLDKLMVIDQLGNSINELEFTEKKPLDKGTSCNSTPASLPEQDTNELKVNDPLVPVNDASLNIIIVMNRVVTTTILVIVQNFLCVCLR
jgi:hypothetical protein